MRRTGAFSSRRAAGAAAAAARPAAGSSPRTRLASLAALLLLPIAALAQPSGANGNLPEPPDRLMRRLAREEFTVEGAADAGGGVTGAKKWTVRFRDGVPIDVKWKAAPSAGDGWNNSPRRELAAYAFQRLLFDPIDYVVPPVALRCIDLAQVHRFNPGIKPNLDNADCLLGTLAAWLDRVELPEPTFDAERFARDRAYARRFAALNLFTYLIEHRDRRGNNFLISTIPGDPRLFSIDNGIAFGGVFYNFFAWHLDRIRVDGLPRQAVERLRKVSREDLDALAVVAELRIADGRATPSDAPGACLDRGRGVRRKGETLQVGLTAEEIEAIAKRRRQLLRRIDRGELVLF